jgi:hypothetical protein
VTTKRAALLRQHIPSITDELELELEEKRFNSDVDRYGQPAVDVADLAVRICHCGVRIEGFYEYVDHLEEVLAKEGL